MNEPLQKDWPADPANDELLQLARELHAAPALPPEALSRVQQQVQVELDASQRRDRRPRVMFGWSIAAAVLLALGGYAYWRSGGNAPGPNMARKNTPDPVLVEDRIAIALGELPVPHTDKPLVRLDENRSLFMD